MESSSLQDRAIKDKDTYASNTVDETIQLWTKMWEADHVHDQTIVSNVQELLEHARSLVESLQVRPDIWIEQSFTSFRCGICG